MSKEDPPFSAERRNFLKTMAMGSAAGILGFAGSRADAAPYEAPAYAKAMPPVKIRSVKAIPTAPSYSNLIVAVSYTHLTLPTI